MSKRDSSSSNGTSGAGSPKKGSPVVATVGSVGTPPKNRPPPTAGGGGTKHQDPNAANAKTQQPQSLIEALLYLLKPTAAMGVHQVMINALFTFPLCEVEVLLPQIMNAAVTHQCDTEQECVAQLKKYLVFLASKSLYVGLRLCWLLESAESQFATFETAKNRVLGLKENIKNATVTHSLNNSFNQHDDNIMERSELFLSQMSFMKQLTKISGKLVAIQDKPSRKLELRKLLDVINKEVLSGRGNSTTTSGTGSPFASPKPQSDSPMKTPTSPTSPRIGGEGKDGRTSWKKQMLFPLATSTSTVQWIVRICSSECVVFSSRERAPYLLWVETITDPNGHIYADPLVAREETNLTDADRQGSPGSKTKRKAAAATAGGGGGWGGGGSSLSSMSINDYAQFMAPVSSKTGENDDSIDALTMVFGESLAQRTARLREQSPFGDEEGWGIQALVIKAGDDLRQEEFALQLIDYFQMMWNEARITAVTRPYSAIATDPSSGLLQFVTDSLSFDSVKKSAGVQTMNQFFVKAYGPEGSRNYSEAQKNFIESMAAYSIICYVLQIKDRHNGNLMLARTGHLIHIDFGFLLATSPGGVNFESAPFKLSLELIEVLGGINSPTFAYFRINLYECYRTIRERADELLALIALVVPQTSLPCFGNDPELQITLIRSRLKLHLTDIELAAELKHMVDVSCDNWRTRKYDQFQTWQNGII